MGIADSLENPDFEWRAAVERQSADETGSVLEHVDRIANRKAASGMPGCVHQILDRTRILVSLLEVKRDFRRQRERRRAEQRLEPFANQTMQLRAADLGQPTVDRLAVRNGGTRSTPIGSHRPVRPSPQRE